MRILYIMAVLALIAGAFFFSSTVAAPINKNATNATLEVELSKALFAVNETITGIIRIPLKENLRAEDNIEIRLQLPMKRVAQEKTLASALANASFNFTQAAEKKQAKNPSDSKTLSFSSGGEKSIAVKVDTYPDEIPGETSVEIDMGISAPDSNTLTNVKLDVGNDGIIDWYYLGTKNGWAASYTEPEGMGSTEGSTLIIDNNNTMFCQVIDLPFAKDFQVYVLYKRLNSAGNISAAIVNIENNDEPPIAPYGLSDFTCDLPEHDGYEWGSCEINDTDYGLHGKYLVCIYSTNGTETDMYEVKSGEAPSATSHTCPRNEEDTCSETTSRNPKMKIKQAAYSKTFRGDIEFKDWDYDSFGVKGAIEDIASNPQPGICGELFCTVELKFIANNSGTFTLSSLDLKYKKDRATTRVTQFYDIETSEAYLGSITKAADNVNLPANATIEIPLEAFGLKAPQPVVSGANTGTLEVRFNGKFANATIAIGGTGIPLSPSTALGMIEETRTALNALNALTGEAQIALKILGKDKDITAAIGELGNLSSMASADTPALRDEITRFRERLPKETTLGSSVRDFQLIEPKDITADIASEDKKESTYLVQEKVQVKASVTTISIKDFAGTTTKYALVKKEITAKSQMPKFDIYEVIDKSVADSTSDIVFETTPTAVVKNDPIVKWFVSAGLSTGAKTEQRYMIKSEFDVPMEKVKTIIVPSAGEDEAPECEGEGCGADEAECGDGICTSILEDAETCPDDCSSKMPWGIIMPIVIVSLLLAIYLGFYRGKYSFWNLTKKKKPFSGKADLESVKTFIRNSRDREMDDSVTKSRLQEKGWTEEQIKFAFAEMEWEKKEKSVENPSENPSPMKEYIKTALSRGMAKDKILANLASKGWKEEDIKKELNSKSQK